MPFSRKTFFFLLIVIFLMILFPDVAEARRGRGGSGGTLWWIPIVLIGGIVTYVNKNIPRLWEYIFTLTCLVFISFFSGIGLNEFGIIEKDDVLLSSVFIFLSIIFGPPIYLKLKNRLKNGK
ncbi:hypothetical protein E5N72_18255 [Pseudoalteromonas sp. MEBiC 03607]|uniref:hypothetical protein n=1 Tax=Pseudoalteromonas sp. MEBiC 03607 TaxID=2563601 RepID=UPI001093E282|nr:hypothetical protein [Pseudoalteromonas sp. MEBiC 03607]TGV17173.1 hypothetical protein E5N72_18255 [Pseudoalteromonas sp. MEBiC 03607]